ncbi:hypothetical protein [Actinoplanes auranticolor]|uniref:Uncharacterized protein n=1 Tax=Actinoplanes auranticolor TaxID=47988 RepID=A0A919VWE2_9ACTN|nr:hypothetical protein [Actinoplanes auranticolor]GIM79361.1 hypothetical protein Aau02nite_85420 [Actinoplanes auranticolor]
MARRPEQDDQDRVVLSERFKTVLGVVSPLAVGTVLLFYFGWVRTKTEAAALGYDSKILEFTTTDYVLRSINVLSVPVVAVLLLALVVLRVHEWLTGRLGASGRLRLARVLLRSWLFWLVAWVFLAQFVRSVATPALPLMLTGAVGLALYGDHLRATVEPDRRWSLSIRVVLGTLLVIAVIADTERLARAMGEGLATSVQADPGQLAAVEIYSAKDLALVVPNVTVTSVGGTDAAYRFRYAGLRLLQRSEDKFLLINEGWTRETGRVLLLRDSGDIRLEFRR